MTAHMTAKTSTLSLTEQEIRTLLVGLSAYSYDLSKEVQENEAVSGIREEFLRLEHAEVRTLINKIRAA